MDKVDDEFGSAVAWIVSIVVVITGFAMLMTH